MRRTWLFAQSAACTLLGWLVVMDGFPAALGICVASADRTQLSLDTACALATGFILWVMAAVFLLGSDGGGDSRKVRDLNWGWFLGGLLTFTLGGLEMTGGHRGLQHQLLLVRGGRYGFPIPPLAALTVGALLLGISLTCFYNFIRNPGENEPPRF